MFKFQSQFILSKETYSEVLCIEEVIALIDDDHSFFFSPTAQTPKIRCWGTFADRIWTRKWAKSFSWAVMEKVAHLTSDNFRSSCVRGLASFLKTGGQGRSPASSSLWQAWYGAWSRGEKAILVSPIFDTSRRGMGRTGCVGSGYLTWTFIDLCFYMFTQCLGLYRVYAHETVLYFQHDFIFPSSKLHKLHFHHIVLIVRFIVALLVSFPKKVDRKNAINIQITRQDLVDWRRWCTIVSFTVRERSFSWTSSTSHNVCHHLSPWFSERHCSAKAGAALLLYLASLFYWCFVATTETSRFVASRSPKSPVDKTRKIIGASLTWTKQKQKKRTECWP